MVLPAFESISHSSSVPYAMIGTLRYRPSAPMCTVEFLTELVDTPIESPYMSFAPRLTARAAAAIPGAAHLDGSARFQTVSSDVDPWMHSLLKSVAALLGWPVLLNTSLNVKGRPIVNLISRAFEIFDNEPEIDFLIVERFLFSHKARLV